MDIAMNLRTLFAVAALLTAAVPAHADEIYRSVMPNGDVLYGETAHPAAKLVSKVQRPPSGVTVVTPGDRARAAQIQPRRGGASVIAPKQRTSPDGGAASGTTYGSTSLPKREY